jgi:hypothetical protein
MPQTEDLGLCVISVWAEFRGDKGLWSALAASVDDFIDIAGSPPLAGKPIKATSASR